MAISVRSTILSVVSAGFIAACSTAPYTPTAFTPQSVDTTAHVAGVGAFAVVVDASSSMDSDYNDRRKFYIAKDVATHMNQTIPELGYTSALVGFGSGSCVNHDDAWVVYGPARYQRSEFENGLSMLECAGGTTPMAKGVDAAGEAVMTGTGNVALILISDFWDIDANSVMRVVNKLKSNYGNRLCIHTIEIGNAHDSDKLIGELAGVNGCGSSVSAASLASSASMANYVTDVLLETAPVPVVTAPVPAVTYEKNVLSASALFDHNSAVLKDEGKAELRDLGEQIKTRSASIVDINIIGHTDSTGAEEYNMGLSVRRAEAVRDYLVTKGIDSSIIHVSGQGESNPVASNATREGRAQNRRVEINVGVKQPAR